MPVLIVGIEDDSDIWMPHPLAKRFVEILAEDLDAEGLAFDADGFISLDFKDRFVFSLVCPDGSPILYLNSDIAAVPNGARLPFIECALKLNYLLLESRGGALGLNEDGDRISYTYGIVLDRIEEEDLIAVLDRFLESSLHLQEQLSQAAREMMDGGETAPAPDLHERAWTRI